MTTAPVRYRVLIYGAVQGVGFRPFVFRLAERLSVAGWVGNIPQGVIVECEGDTTLLDQFVSYLRSERPPLASIHAMEVTQLDPAGYSGFEIRVSSDTGQKQALILPDIALCPDCRRELFDPTDRRFLYPFINCTNCGPRFTIIRSLPYDRPNTSMDRFTMCPDCQREYDDPRDRRFHAQPNACPVCGPQVRLTDERGSTLAVHQDALESAAAALRKGRIVAVKGIGGFHLLTDATSEVAVQRLRQRKHREEKPFALMMPDLDSVRTYCDVSVQEEEALISTAAPIVLLRRRRIPRLTEIAEAVAPGHPLLGMMLPYAPLHAVLMSLLHIPLVATSGNLSDEPICIGDEEALQRLGDIADLFLLHDRPILRPADDSVVRIIAGRETVLRRGRGLAPLPVMLEHDPGTTVLAVGGHLKNTIAVNNGNAVFISQHIGDLETEGSLSAFRSSISDLCGIYGRVPDIIAADLHPDYLSSQWTLQQPQRTVRVQHHQAHIFSCMAEHHLTAPLLGVSWDGTGFGTDGMIWGGEFFSWDGNTIMRIGTFRPFPLPGGAAAVKEPRRTALGVLHECTGGDWEQYRDLPCADAFTDAERGTLRAMMDKGVNSPMTTSAGRLFDAVSALLGVRQTMAYEGQAALELESLAAQADDDGAYPFKTGQPEAGSTLMVVDWQPMFEALIGDLRAGGSKGTIARKFHRTMAEIICTMVRSAGASFVVLSGGCFQNALLTEMAVATLEEDGRSVYRHQRVPPNDGGLSLGQLYGTLLGSGAGKKSDQQRSDHVSRNTR